MKSLISLTLCTTLWAGSVVNIPASSSIVVPDGGYFCADEITVAAGGTFTSSSPDDVCVTPTGEGDISLPVQLSFFRAQSDIRAGEVLLTWETESEIENLGFLIERRQSDNEPWIEIASYITHSELEGQGSKAELTSYSFVDNTVVGERFYDYRLGDVSYAGEICYHLQPIVGIYVERLIPDSYFLSQNYPNPFNPSTTIQYGLSEDTGIRLTIYNTKGQQIMRLVDLTTQNAGYYDILWNGIDQQGRQISTGVYLTRIETDDFTKVIKMVYLR